MSETIYKYKLEIVDRQTLKIPGFFCFLQAQSQNGELCIWAIVEPDQEIKEVEIIIAGTGNPLPVIVIDECIYNSTVQMDGLVWHIFYKY